jgi:DNA repair protein RadC
MANKKQVLKDLKGHWTASRIVVQYRSVSLVDTPIRSHEDAYKIVISVWDKELINLQEQVMAFFLNRRNMFIGYRLICSGTSHQCFIDVKFLVSLALHTMASTVILAHNHPSGRTEPSNADKVITEKIKLALELINVKLIEHIIITEDRYYSFAEGSEL